jgi:hypothetical protein
MSLLLLAAAAAVASSFSSSSSSTLHTRTGFSKSERVSNNLTKLKFKWRLVHGKLVMEKQTQETWVIDGPFNFIEYRRKSQHSKN